jgi:hypothetical protein
MLVVNRLSLTWNRVFWGLVVAVVIAFWYVMSRGPGAPLE